MLANLLTRTSRPIRYAAGEPVLQPVDMGGLHNWLRAQLLGRGTYTPLRALSRLIHTNQQQTGPDAMQRLMSGPENVGLLHALLSHPDAESFLGSQAHPTAMRTLMHMQNLFRDPEPYLPAYTPGHPLHGAANEAMAGEIRPRLHQLDINQLVGAAPSQHGNRIRELIKPARFQGHLEPLLDIANLIGGTGSTHTSQAHDTLRGLIEHHVKARDMISRSLNGAQTPRHDRPMESVPEDYYAL